MAEGWSMEFRICIMPGYHDDDEESNCQIAEHKSQAKSAKPLFDFNFYTNQDKCGNCHEKGHRVIHCVKQTILGDIAACPFCNHDDHIGSDCGGKSLWWEAKKWELCWNPWIGLPPLRLPEDLFAEAINPVGEKRAKGCPMTRDQARIWRKTIPRMPRESNGGIYMTIRLFDGLGRVSFHKHSPHRSH
ncbi:hypothetical protein B0T22DRAFT_448811 [Podospora appendiculata]|uniref:CCHC-type domain-containing protein n=1 Tax=Podospora appendiculata TaxID=314037 RepID=A0AAE0XGW7_9PEZI|nr:hypothetical protein B0T22DRAFT_448811 [Podospora appendiculata]